MKDVPKAIEAVWKIESTWLIALSRHSTLECCRHSWPAPFDSDVGTATVVNGHRQAGPVRPRAPAAMPRVLRPSLREAYWLQEILALPEEPLMVHPPVHPVADRRHADREPLARGGNGLPIWRGHRPREGAGHDAGDRRPATGTEAYRARPARSRRCPGRDSLGAGPISGC